MASTPGMPRAAGRDHCPVARVRWAFGKARRRVATAGLARMTSPSEAGLMTMRRRIVAGSGADRVGMASPRVRARRVMTRVRQCVGMVPVMLGSRNRGVGTCPGGVARDASRSCGGPCAFLRVWRVGENTRPDATRWHYTDGWGDRGGCGWVPCVHPEARSDAGQETGPGLWVGGSGWGSWAGRGDRVMLP